MERIKILVTGACGVTSRSVVRSLNESRIFAGKCEFIGTDVCYNEYGIYEGLYKKVYKVPYFNSESYRPIMERIIAENKIEYAILIPEPEVLYWSEHPFGVKFLRIPPRFAKTVLSKRSLYETLSTKSYIPKFQILSREEMLSSEQSIQMSYPLWIRDYSEGTTSGKGSLMATCYDDVKAWATINRNIPSFMLSEYLEGRNLGCFTLFHHGELIKYGVAQRIDYLMGKVAVSGVTGNTCKGKLLNDKKAFEVAYDAVLTVASKTGETMNGLVVTDLKENAKGEPIVTEINIRHVAFTSTFAKAGLNFSEYQLLCLMGKRGDISKDLTMIFPDDNCMLRDVDGVPIYLEHYSQLKEGDVYEV
jgi:carbamoyl-phosphate synthase large subunit